MSSPMDMRSFYTKVGQREAKAQRARIAPGKHVFGLKWYGWRETRSFGMAVDADLVVVESTSMEPGTVCSKRFFVQGGSNPEASQDQLKLFICALLGISSEQEVIEGGMYLESEGQPGAGRRIRCEAWQPTGDDGQPVKDKKGRAVTNESWDECPDTAETVQETLDIIAGKVTPAASPPVSAPVTAPVTPPPAAPAPSQGDLLKKFGVK